MVGTEGWLSSVGWGGCLGWTGQELNSAETSLSFHGAVLLMVMGVTLLSHTYLTKPTMTWHVLDSLCGGDANRSLGTCRGESSVTVAVAAPSLHMQQNHGWGVCEPGRMLSFWS